MMEQPSNENEINDQNTRRFNTPTSNVFFDQKREMKLGKCEPYKPDPIGPRPVAAFVRFAPTPCFDHECIKVDQDSNTVSIECSAATGRLLCSKNVKCQTMTPNRKYLSFGADRVFSNASQEDFFTNAIEDMVDKALDGYSGTVIACGAVGSGKTYTLFSPNEKYQYRGVVVRCVERLFCTLAEWSERTAAISMNFIEVVGENIYDLLRPKKPAVTITDNGKTFQLNGMYTERVITAEMALVALFRGCALRTTHQHPRNAKGSSTGHALLTLKIESRSLVETEPFDRYAELAFVDMAGFEKVRSWEQGAHRLSPGVVVDVNKSMAFLEQLIMSMAEHRSYLPVRVTKLTHILKSKIGNKCDTRLIACTSGEEGHLAETLATLRFAVRLRGVICNPQQELIDDPTLMLTKLKKDLAGLQQELFMQDMMARRAPKMHGELSYQERAIVSDQVELFLDGRLDNIQIVSVKQIEAVLESVRTIQARRESDLREQLTAEAQQQLQQQLQQFQQQLAAGPPAPAAADHRPNAPAHGRERGGKRKTSRARVGKDSADDERAAAGDRAHREERQTSAGAASTDQSGPGFGVGAADGRPNAAAVAMSARARGRAAARPASPPASPAEEPADETDVPLPTEAGAVGSQEALRQLLAADNGRLQAELDRCQAAIGEQHQQYAALARQLRELRCQHSGVLTELQLVQMERHVQGERYDVDGDLVLSADERRLTAQLRQLDAQLADGQDRLLTLRRDLLDAQRQQTEAKAELATALADLKLRTDVQPEAAAAAAAAARGSSVTAASAAVQASVAPEPGAPGSPSAYYSAQRRARAQLRRIRCPK